MKSLKISSCSYMLTLHGYKCPSLKSFIGYKEIEVHDPSRTFDILSDTHTTLRWIHRPYVHAHPICLLLQELRTVL